MKTTENTEITERKKYSILRGQQKKGAFLKSVISSFAAVIFALLGLFTFRTWWIGLQAAQLTEPSRTMDTRDAPHVVSTDSLRSLQPSLLHPAAPHVALFERLAGEADREPDLEKRGQLWCAALGEMGKALKADPRNASYLINWANLRQLLGNETSCSEDLTSGPYEAAVTEALAADPTNVDVLFAGARILEWAGKRGEAQQRLKQVLSLATSLSSAQQQFIAQRMQSPEDVKAILPARFPQVTSWSVALSDNNPVLFRSAADVLTALQLTAIRESRHELDRAVIPAEIHERRLLSLYRAPASGKVRRELDHEIASQSGARGQSSLAHYLAERRRLQEADIVRAAIASDTRPASSPLLQWAPQNELCIDDFYASIGFYLPEGEAPKLIELRSEGLFDDSLRSSLRILVSEDNQSWSELQGNIQSTVIKLGDKTVLAVRPNSGYYKYWKLSLHNSVRTKHFCDAPQRLLVVYRTAMDAYS